MTQPTVAPPRGSKLFQRHWTWWFMVATLVVIAAFRLRLLNFPLERDEGEYAYSGQLMLQGIPPYELAYNMKFPGTYAAYAVIMKLFGETPAAIHFGILLLTTATALMLYWLGKKILDETAGAVAATAYATLAASTAMFGLAGHATHFCAFFATAGLCAMWSARQNGKLLVVAAAGLFFGLSILMKQHAMLIAAWAAIAFTAMQLRKFEIPLKLRLTVIAIFGAAMVLPFATCCLILWMTGVLGEFWFWTVGYAGAYVSIFHVSDLWSRLWWSLRSIFSDCWLWWFAVAGLGVVWFDRRLRETRVGLLGFTLGAALAICPGFYFRTHYFLLLLPAAALLAGCAVSGISNQLRQKIGAAKFSAVPAGVYVLILAFTLSRYNEVGSVLARGGNHAMYGNEPFAEAETVAEFIREHSPPDARVAVLGSEPEIYFLSHRRSATGYIYTYALMEPQPFARRMQDEFIRQTETNAPEFVVFANVNSSWQQRPESDLHIFGWWKDYQTNFDLVGIADMAQLFQTRFFWNEDAAKYGKLKNIGLEVYRRKIQSLPVEK